MLFRSGVGLRVDYAESAGEKPAGLRELLNPGNSYGCACIGPTAIERNSESVVYIRRPIDADRKSCVRSNTQFKHILIDEGAVGLNRAATGWR